MMQGSWYYCLKHHAVEPYEACKAIDRLGPYESREDAEHALEQVARRNDEWDEAAGSEDQD